MPINETSQSLFQNSSHIFFYQIILSIKVYFSDWFSSSNFIACIWILVSNLTKTITLIEDIENRIRTISNLMLSTNVHFSYIFSKLHACYWNNIKLTDINNKSIALVSNAFKYFMEEKNIKDINATLERSCILLNSFCRFYTQVSGVSLHILRVCEIWHNCHHSLSFTLVKSPFSSICHLGMDFK